jgi:hypothetical protein
MLENSSVDRSPVVVSKKRARSAVTNGTTILPGVDGRSSWVRRLRDLVALHVNDLGGDSNVSEAERAIIRRACVLITELERMEHDFALAQGAPGLAELEIYQRLSNTMRRLLESTGLKRRARDVTPTLGELLGEIAARRDMAQDSDAGGDAGPGRDESELQVISVSPDTENVSSAVGIPKDASFEPESGGAGT